jgi:hypothetical protein
LTLAGKKHQSLGAVAGDPREADEKEKEAEKQ